MPTTRSPSYSHACVVQAFTDNDQDASLVTYRPASMLIRLWYKPHSPSVVDWDSRAAPCVLLEYVHHKIDYVSALTNLRQFARHK